MKQVGVDLCNLPEVDGFKHLIILIDYLSKWSEVKPVKDKSDPTVGAFLYEVRCGTAALRFKLMTKVKNSST